MVPIETVRMRFTGRFAPDSFAAFANRRAERLDLGLALETGNPSLFDVTVSGQPDLIDAFEMACSLGPMDCLVLDCERATLHSGYMENRNR